MVPKLCDICNTDRHIIVHSAMKYCQGRYDKIVIKKTPAVCRFAKVKVIDKSTKFMIGMEFIGDFLFALERPTMHDAYVKIYILMYVGDMCVTCMMSRLYLSMSGLGLT